MIIAFPVHLACAALVAGDMLARALRIRLLVTRVGAQLSFRDALRLNLLGDAAAELTPFRIAGEPARAGALLQAGITTEAALLAVGAEFALTYAIVALFVVAASWATLPAWWSSIRPVLYHAVSHVPVSVAALLAVAVLFSVRMASRLRTATNLPRLGGIQSSLRTLAGVRSRHLAALAGLSLINIAARVGILLILVASLPGARAAGTIIVGSFLLLFGQAFAPTPSGLGVVELGMLGGAAGPLGGHGLSILVYWRVYTAVVPIILAAVFAVPRFGAAPMFRLLRSHRTAVPVSASVTVDSPRPGPGLLS